MVAMVVVGMVLVVVLLAVLLVVLMLLLSLHSAWRNWYFCCHNELPQPSVLFWLPQPSYSAACSACLS
jgi:hypothetical protein